MLESFSEWGYTGLFLASFLSATVLPFSSEVVFTAVVWKMKLDPWACVALATAGNTLGGMTCYWLGLLGKMEWIERFLRLNREKIDKWVARLHRQGDWIAFFTFLPVVGDVIAVACGFLRCRWWIVFGFMLAGKGLRYAALLLFF
ncbi:MAG: DedA family protein [Prevotellaceae bacterium]|jgi:membrane protein YqaA with SNARE-associated domain|nr:DedA family protein [Prevotellaceae bacterium]